MKMYQTLLRDRRRVPGRERPGENLYADSSVRCALASRASHGTDRDCGAQYRPACSRGSHTEWVQSLHEAELAVFGTAGERIAIEAKEDATLLVLNGQSIDEPVARHGPFVMNTQEELIQAVKDYRMGKMGHLD